MRRRRFGQRCPIICILCVTGFERDRPELAALALSSDGGLLGAVGATGSGGNATQYLARQIRALGQPGDLLLLMSVSGNDVVMQEALEAAHERDMMAVVLTDAPAAIWRLMCARPMC